MTVNLSWNAVTGAVSYNVYRSKISGGFGLFKIGSTSGTVWVDGPDNIPKGVTFYYYVTSLTSDGESALSAQVVGALPPTPLAPTNFIATIT